MHLPASLSPRHLLPQWPPHLRSLPGGEGGGESLGGLEGSEVVDQVWSLVVSTQVSMPSWASGLFPPVEAGGSWGGVRWKRRVEAERRAARLLERVQLSSLPLPLPWLLEPLFSILPMTTPLPILDASGVSGYRGWKWARMEDPTLLLPGGRWALGYPFTPLTEN